MGAESKPLIIAEKPSAARAIAEALGGFSRREGYLESSRYLLGWAVGHLVELMAPEEYDGRWKRWSIQSLPIDPAVFGLKVSRRTGAQFELLVSLARRASALINACDAGREGELIFRFIIERAGLQMPVQRLWISSLTREAIQKGFADLRPQSAYDRVYQSALCRARGDWLVGMNSTRAFTVKWGELLSVGRVQTPTLALLVRREAEIERFVPEAYWEVHGQFCTAAGGHTYPGKWFGPQGDRLPTARAAEAVRSRVADGTGTVESVEEKPVSERAPQLFDLTSLQREANKRFGLTAAATLKAAQSLYERKLITYPRTDSRFITRDLVPTLPGVVKALSAQPEFRAAAGGADLARVHPGNRRVVDDAKVTDHHAILPTAEGAFGLAGVDAKVYGLVARRFLAQFYPEAQYLETEVVTAVGEDRFRSRGRTLLEAGWTVVEAEPVSRSARKRSESDEEAVRILPPLQSGEAVGVRGVEVREKSTQPPKRFTEATLLSAMEYAGREMDDEALKEAMKGRGLGTPATRAAIIERLKTVGYVVIDKKSLAPTPKGRLLVERAEEAGASVLLSAELTGEWERRIADVQSGGESPDRFMAEIRELARQVVEWVRAAGDGAAPVRRTAGAGRAAGSVSAREERPAGSDAELPATAGRCPRCGRAVVNGSKGYLCANAECGLRIPSFLCGKVIDPVMAASLLEKGRTPLIKSFRSPRTGKEFSAFLVLKAERVEFEFPSDRPRAASGYRRHPTGGQKSGAAATKTGPRSPGSEPAGGGTPGRSRREGPGRGRSGPRAQAGPGADGGLA